MPPKKQPEVRQEVLSEVAPPIRRYALIHVLTPEFQGLNPDDFADISDFVLERSSPENLQPLLIERSLEEKEDVTTVSYRSADGPWIRVAVTPEEFVLFSRHIPMLAKTAFSGVLNSRDQKLRTETGNPAARARTEEDFRAANRSSARQVMKKQDDMERYLAEGIAPRTELVEKFIEMVRNPNLVRGTEATIKERFEYLRTFVFGDMLDAIGNQRQWSPELAERAEKILQKRLYLEPTPAKRYQNFVAMLELAREYYGHKRALLLGRIAESQKWQRDHPRAVQDVKETDAEREQERRLALGQTEREPENVTQQLF